MQLDVYRRIYDAGARRRAFTETLDRIRRQRPDVLVTLEFFFADHEDFSLMLAPFQRALRIVLAYTAAHLSDGALPAIDPEARNEVVERLYAVADADGDLNLREYEHMWHRCYERMRSFDPCFMDVVRSTVKQDPDLLAEDRKIARFYIAFFFLCLLETVRQSDMLVRQAMQCTTRLPNRRPSS